MLSEYWASRVSHGGFNVVQIVSLTDNPLQAWGCQDAEPGCRAFWVTHRSYTLTVMVSWRNTSLFSLFWRFIAPGTTGKEKCWEERSSACFQDSPGQASHQDNEILRISMRNSPKITKSSSRLSSYGWLLIHTGQTTWWEKNKLLILLVAQLKPMCTKGKQRNGSQIVLCDRHKN